MSITTFSVDVTAQATYPATAQIIVPYQTRTLAFFAQNSQRDAFFSFDGVNDAVHVDATNSSAGVSVSQHILRVWARRGAAGAGNTVQVIVED